jgi:hypothetical protein
MNFTKHKNKYCHIILLILIVNLQITWLYTNILIWTWTLDWSHFDLQLLWETGTVSWGMDDNTQRETLNSKMRVPTLNMYTVKQVCLWGTNYYRVHCLVVLMARGVHIKWGNVAVIRLPKQGLLDLKYIYHRARQRQNTQPTAVRWLVVTVLRQLRLSSWALQPKEWW